MTFTRSRLLKTALRLLLALVAIVGQSAVVCIGSAPDEAGAASHVERSGVSLHHAHNEATCVVCRVLSLHGRTESQSAPLIVSVLGHDARPSVATLPVERAGLPTNLSRAPPEIA